MAFHPVDVVLRQIDTATGGLLARALGGEEFNGKKGETVLLYDPPGIEVARLLLVGLGSTDGAGQESGRLIGGTAARRLRSSGVRQIAIALPEAGADPAGIRAGSSKFASGWPNRNRTIKIPSWNGLMLPSPLTSKASPAASK